MSGRAEILRCLHVLSSYGDEGKAIKLILRPGLDRIAAFALLPSVRLL